MPDNLAEKTNDRMSENTTPLPSSLFSLIKDTKILNKKRIQVLKYYYLVF